MWKRGKILKKNFLKNWVFMNMEGYIGEIKLFPKDWIPNGWMVCDGREVKFKDYNILSVICGVEWPEGYRNGEDVDPELTFNLPNVVPPSEDVHYIICYQGLFPAKF